MLVAAAICSRHFGADEAAAEILGAAGLTTMAEIRAVKGDAYDAMGVRRVLRRFREREAAFEERPATMGRAS